jgi:tetraacyldisaccharide 4'-kinase
MAVLRKKDIEDIMYGRKRSFLIEAMLFGLSLLYRAIIRMRRALYRCRMLKSHELPCTVISVGNITLGGTGKTPMVIAIAGLLAEKQRRPAVVSRGYGRKDEKSTVIVSDGKSVLADTRAGGDEPVLIGSRLSGVPVVAASRRYRAARYALEHFDAKTVILDDGFQHLGLRRNLDIVLVDAADPFGNGRLFPAGILREPASALHRAHAVVITRADASQEVDALKQRIGRITAARIFTSVQRPVDLVEIRSGEARALSVLSGARVFAFSGIARPASFLATLRALGVVIAAERAYPDHQVYDKSDLADVFQKAADHGADMIVTTEKDAVRLRELRPEGIWALRIEQEVLERREWQRFLLDGI